MEENKQEKNLDTEEIYNTLAAARLELAQQILRAENAPHIMNAMNELCLAYLKTAEMVDDEKGAGNRKAKKFRTTADEVFTVLMCAMYNKINTLGG